MRFLKWLGKRILKTVLYLVIPSALLFFARYFFKEETEQVTNKVQRSTCEVAVLSQLKAQIASESDAKKASEDYCECLSNRVDMGSMNIFSEFSLGDISKLKDNPNLLMEKMKNLAQKEGVVEAGRDCMSYIIRDYDIRPLPSKSQSGKGERPRLQDVIQIRDNMNKRQQKVNEQLETLEEEH